MRSFMKCIDYKVHPFAPAHANIRHRPWRGEAWVAILAGVLGAFIVSLGALGIFGPAEFMAMVEVFQTPTMVYAAAAIRVALGAALIVCAAASRWPTYLRLLGGMILIGGLVTPFGGAWLGRTLIDLWPSWGPGVVRSWGALAAVLGMLVVYSVLARKAQ
jgi:hypothetical protein